MITMKSIDKPKEFGIVSSLIENDPIKIASKTNSAEREQSYQRLQEKIAKLEKKYRQIFEGSHEMIFTFNSAGQLLDVNKAGIEMLGYCSKAELLRIGSFKGLFRNKEDKDRFFEAINREGLVKDYKVEFKKRDNSPVHVLISSWQHENPNTGKIEWEGIIKDISHRKYLEDDLQNFPKASIVESLKAPKI
jgi:PAS domain S-box-containing protein